MKYLPTERDRHLVHARALAWARAGGLTGNLRQLAASKAELDFWERWRALDDDAQLATFTNPQPSSLSSRGSL